MCSPTVLPAEWLGSRLSVRSLDLVPELSLWLLGDDVDLHQRASEVFAVETAPYWAFCWGSGQALARYLLDHPELVRDREVVDFGAGCGVAAIAALRAGARAATAVDIDAVALAACEENAALNGVRVATSRELPSEFDVLLASDVLYEVGNRDLLRAHIEAGRTVLVSDPLRHGMPRLALEPTCAYDVRTVPDVDHPIARAVVYDLSQRSGAPTSP